MHAEGSVYIYMQTRFDVQSTDIMSELVPIVVIVGGEFAGARAVLAPFAAP